MLLENLRRKVLETARQLPDFGLVWMAGGTACARDLESGYVVVTPSGLSYAGLSPADMIVVDTDMTVIEGDYRPSVATNLWLSFFHARPDIHGIVHTHSPMRPLSRSLISQFRSLQKRWLIGLVQRYL
ncbi:MAG: class II aldolase/adducin family protein [Chloroflexi bacterium]|nr:class II aldolase/adducin family protein [Chloroflexota bacterium]